MERTRWEILVLAAAILIGALAIASSMKANRYAFHPNSSNGLYYICDTQTGEIYGLASPGQAARFDNEAPENKRTWKKAAGSVK
jgi:hypothetical protein